MVEKLPSGRGYGLVPDVLHTVGSWEEIEVSCSGCHCYPWDQDDIYIYTYIWIIGIIIQSLPWKINMELKNEGF